MYDVEGEGALLGCPQDAQRSRPGKPCGTSHKAFCGKRPPIPYEHPSRHPDPLSPFRLHWRQVWLVTSVARATLQIAVGAREHTQLNETVSLQHLTGNTEVMELGTASGRALPLPLRPLGTRETKPMPSCKHEEHASPRACMNEDSNAPRRHQNAVANSRK